METCPGSLGENALSGGESDTSRALVEDQGGTLCHGGGARREGGGQSTERRRRERRESRALPQE